MTRAPRLTALLALALVAAPVGAAHASPVAPLPSIATIGPTFGGRAALSAAMSGDGTTRLTWERTTGSGTTIETATVAPGAGEGSRPTRVASGTAFWPQMAVAPGGAATIAWARIHKSEHLPEYLILAIKASDLPAGGGSPAASNVWVPPGRIRWGLYSIRVARDEAGDEAVMWVASLGRGRWHLMVSTRAAGGAFGPPATLDSNAVAGQTALAVGAGGQVVVTWADGPGDLRIETWRAGSRPGGAAIVQSAEEASAARRAHDPQLSADSAGDVLATWVFGAHQEGRPAPVAVRAAWIPAGGSIQAPFTVSEPGVEAEAPSVAFAPDGRALLAWSEIAADGHGPLLDVAFGAPDRPFATVAPTSVALPAYTTPEAGWLADGRALLAWAQPRENLEAIAPGGTTEPVLVLPVFPSGPMLLAAGGAGPPLLVWIGASPQDGATEAVRFLDAGTLFGTPAPAFAPSAELASTTGSQVVVRLNCPEACSYTASARLYGLRSQNAEEAAGTAFHAVASYPSSSGSIQAGAAAAIVLRGGSAMQRARCSAARHGRKLDVEVTVRVTATDGVSAHRTLELGEKPQGGSCR